MKKDEQIEIKPEEAEEKQGNLGALDYQSRLTFTF